MNVLFVDDDLATLELAETFLEKEDDELNIETAPSAEKGLELLKERNYDAIASDYKMPVMDGLEFLKTVREDKGSDVPFIIFTGKGREEVIIDALNLGADRYLEKGTDPKSQYGVLAETIVEEVRYRRTRKEFRESERIFKRSFEANPDLVFLFDKAGACVDVNETALQVLGFEKGEVVGSSLQDNSFLSDEAVKKTTDRLERRDKGEEISPYLVDLKTKDGERITTEVNIGKLEEETFEGAIVIAREITERKRILKEVRREKERYEELFRGANEMVITTDEKGYVKRVNKRVEEVSGYSEEELRGESILKITPLEERNKYIEFWKRIREGKKTAYELKGRTKHGETTYLYARGRPIIEDGEIVEIQYNAQDITERKKAEKRQEHLHSLLRHELINKLCIADGYLHLLKKSDLSQDQEEYLEKNEKSIRDGFDLIEKVRTLKKVDKEEIGEIEVQKIIEKGLEKQKTRASKKGISIGTELIKKRIVGGNLLKELFSNLVENSISHSEANIIRVSVDELGDECVVKVEDDGKGIPDEEKAKIFSKGYRKGKNAGSGLGLYLVEEIAKNYGGSVEVKDSELGGARFDVRLQKN